MAKHINIKGSEAEITVELDEGPTASKIWDRLPFEASANLWGDEVYFRIPVSVDAEPGAREVVEVGDVGYWPAGEALCLFFGPTPASSGREPRAASPVTVVGRVVEGLENCSLVASGEPLSVEGVEE